MPDLTERQKLAEQYPPESGPYRVVDEGTGHQVTVAVVRPGMKVLDGEQAVDENGRFVPPVYADAKAAKSAAKTKEV